MQWYNMSIADLFVLPGVQMPIIAFLILSLWVVTTSHGHIAVSSLIKETH
jgi:hypothetical protein